MFVLVLLLFLTTNTEKYQIWKKIVVLKKNTGRATTLVMNRRGASPPPRMLYVRPFPVTAFYGMTTFSTRAKENVIIFIHVGRYQG